jgi:hypothetical protein
MVDLVQPMVRAYLLLEFFFYLIFEIQAKTISNTEELPILGSLEQQGNLSPS